MAEPEAPSIGRLRSVAALWPAAVIVALVLVYVALNLPRLAEQSFWTDELWSVGDANRDNLALLLRYQAVDNHPPFYGMVLWAWIRLTGDATEATVRLVSLVAIASGVVILSLAAWRRLGLGAAMVVITLALSSTLLVDYAREARMHALAFLLMSVATSAWIFLLSRRGIRPGLLLVFAAAGGLAAITQYYGLLVYPLEAAVLVAWLVLARSRRAVVAVAVVTGVSLAPAGLWLLRSRPDLMVSGTPKLTLAWGETVAGWIAEPYASALLGPDPAARPAIAFVTGVILLSVLALLAGVVVSRRGPAGPGAKPATGSQGAPARDTGTSERLALGLTALGVAVVAAAAGTIQSIIHVPTLHFRSVISILPALYVGLGAAASVPFRRFATVAALVVVTLLAVTAARTPEPGQYVKDQWREAAAFIRDEQQGGFAASRIVLVRDFGHGEWNVALNNAYGRRAPNADQPPQLQGMMRITGAAGLASITADEPLLLVAFHGWAWDAHAATVTATQQRFGPCQDRSVTGIAILSCPGTRGR